MPTQTQLRTDITSRIVESLKNGHAPWRQPWTNDPNCGFPANLISKRPYRGINPLLLEIAAFGNGFSSRYWATYKQWQQAGGQVRQGEKGTHIVFWRVLDKPKPDADAETGSNRTERFFLLRSYVVFNLNQVDGSVLDHFRPGQGEQPSVEVDWHAADKVIAATDANISYGGNKAYYARPSGSWPQHSGGDFIVVPHRNQFADVRDFYDGQFHELGHWSECRLGWTGSYAMGELVAEIGAAFMARHLNLPQSENMDNHNAYLASWLMAMNDPKFIFQAASQASKVADFVLAFSQPAAQPAVAEAGVE